LASGISRPEPASAAAGSIAVLLGLLWTWWAVDRGAYFPEAFYPGAAVLAALLGAMLLWAPLPGRIAGAPRIALVALVSIGALALLSAVWSPTPGAAVSDFHHASAYAGAFLLGLWLCLVAGRRMLLSVGPLVLAGTLVAGLTLGALAIGPDPGGYLARDMTLKQPLGYRNANAAFFLISFWACVSLLAGDRAIGRRTRAGVSASATLCLGLALLCQSRGSLLACAVAAAVYMAAAPQRTRAAIVLAVTALPAVAAAPWIFAVFSSAGTRAAATGPVRDAAIAIVLSAAVAAGLGLASTRLEGRLALPGRLRRGAAAIRAGRGLRAAAAGLTCAILGLGLLGATGGDPVGFVRERAAQVDSTSNPDFDGRATRFSLDASSTRYDAWRVAAATTPEHPILGGGAGSFESTYLAHRHTDDTLRDPHSVEMLFLAELGLLGLALFCAFALATTRGALRSRRLGPAASGLSLSALTVGSYWLAHASVDWFWNYPALTAPVLALLGAACGPAVVRPAATRPALRGRLPAVAGVALLALTMLPPYLSVLWTNRAYAVWRSDPGAAYASLRRAEAANPLAQEPLLAEGTIASRRGELARAARAFRRASELEPADWAPRYLLGRVLLRVDPRAAAGSFRDAISLNPGNRPARRGVVIALRKTALERAG
jgi:hypothetical protein